VPFFPVFLKKEIAITSDVFVIQVSYSSIIQNCIEPLVVNFAAFDTIAVLAIEII
jgi:hypothetical protein